jgi:hypothetical protein
MRLGCHKVGVGQPKRWVSDNLLRPKFNDERQINFTKCQSSDSSELCDLAYGWGKIVTRRASVNRVQDWTWISTRLNSWPWKQRKPWLAGPSKKLSKLNFDMPGDVEGKGLDGCSVGQVVELLKDYAPMKV